jgi:hypothetical protein
MMMWRIPLLIMRSAGISREMKEEVMTVMVTMLRKSMRKRNKGVVISSLVDLISESPTILPTEDLLIIIRQDGRHWRS